MMSFSGMSFTICQSVSSVIKSLLQAPEAVLMYHTHFVFLFLEINPLLRQSIANMCGPMQKKDPLHFVTLAIALMVLALSSGGIFNPSWVRTRTSSKDQVLLFWSDLFHSRIAGCVFRYCYVFIGRHFVLHNACLHHFIAILDSIKLHDAGFHLSLPFLNR